MTVHGITPGKGYEEKLSRVIETPELLSRLAEDLRARSGSDLPLSCYVEQVRLQLASGKSPEDIADPTRVPANSNIADCYRAWAMPDHA